MNFPELNASSFGHNSDNYNNEFERIMSKIVLCYNQMISNNVLLDNDENEIRDILLISYLKNNEVRSNLELTDYLFDREVPEDVTVGRTDIKIQTLDTFKETEAYYIIECKRIDAQNQQGNTGLNGAYINNGILRYVTNRYSSFYKVNGMIGFVVQNIDIDQNIGYLNELLRNTFQNANTIDHLTRCEIIPEFTFHYTSKHRAHNNHEVKIHHIMMDFSNNMKP